MQYRQARRILTEILLSRRAGSEVVLPALGLLIRWEELPRLGPYRKRSTEQALWRIASDPTGRVLERWTALQRLLQLTPCGRDLLEPASRRKANGGGEEHCRTRTGSGPSLGRPTPK